MERKFGRKIYFDSASRGFGIRQFVFDREPEAKPKTNYWKCKVVLDQGNEGACVGFAWAHELAAEPGVVDNVDNAVARGIYYDAQRLDPWEGGEYPEAVTKYSGTVILAGAKAAMTTGLVGGYYWGFGLDDLLLGIGYHGPAVMGLNWYEGMGDPDDAGLIHPTGKMVGGHAILARGVDVEKELICLHNSWGPGWGEYGDCWITFADMERLLKQGGEACFALGRRTEPMSKPIGYN